MSLSESLHDEIYGVDWRERAQTMLMTAGITAFGFALGVHWMAHTVRDSLYTVNPFAAIPTGIKTGYSDGMLLGLGVALVGICGAMLLEFRRRDADE